MIPAPEHPGGERVLTPSVVVLLAAVSMLTAVSIDIMLPATAIIARQYGVPANLGGLLVGVYFLGYAVGQLVWGLASDAFGRKPIMLMSLAGFTLASLGCAFAPNYETLIGLRLLQGLAGGAPVVARAVSRDLGTGPATTRLLALLLATNSVGPLIAPAIGSGLLVLFDWRACFLFLALAGLVLLVLTHLMFDETLSGRRPERFSFGFVVTASATLFRERDFLMGGGLVVLTFAGYGSVLALGAVLVTEVYGLSPAEFGAIFAIAACFNAAGSLSVRSLIHRLGLETMTGAAAAVMTVSLAMHVSFLFTTPSLPVFWTSVCLYLLSFGLVVAAGMSIAMRPAGSMPGYAASLLGATMMVGAFVGGAIASALYTGDHTVISASMVVFGGAAVVLSIWRRLS